MIKLTEAQLYEACEDLSMGMKVFYNLETGEINSIPDFDEFDADDDGLWEDLIKEVESNPKKNIELYKMSSHRSFEIMENFAQTVTDISLKNRLLNSLDRKHPFRNFKTEIDRNEHYRQQWFKFKENAYVQFIKEQIEELNELYNPKN